MTVWYIDRADLHEWFESGEKKQHSCGSQERYEHYCESEESNQQCCELEESYRQYCGSKGSRQDCNGSEESYQHCYYLRDNTTLSGNCVVRLRSGASSVLPV